MVNHVANQIFYIWGIHSQIGRCLTMTPFDLSQHFLCYCTILKNTEFFKDFFDNTKFFYKFLKIWNFASMKYFFLNLKNPVSDNKIFAIWTNGLGFPILQGFEKL